MLEVRLYSRKDCHLCEQASQDLLALQEKTPHQLIEFDVDDDEKLLREYGFDVPVVVAGPYTLRAPFTIQALEITLRAATQRQEQNLADAALPMKSAELTWTGADRFNWWLARHWLTAFNVFIGLYLGLSFLAPVLMATGFTTPARLLYRFYSVSCHQLAFRSWFLFGEQPYYPRLDAGVFNAMDYQQATKMSENDIWTAREFVGDPRLGYKVALCQRDVAIYACMLLFGIIYGLTGKKIRGLPLLIFVLVGVFPIGLDGVSQLISQPPLNLLPYRESTPFLRSLTGGLFGLAAAWFGYPIAESGMRETRQYMEDKLRRLQAQQRQAAVQEALPQDR